MSPPHTIAIVGAGLAGAKAAEGARDAGYDGRIVLVGAEAELPYERPPLSKEVLRGEKPPESARVHDPAFYEEHDIELLGGRTVVELDAHQRELHLDGGERVPFSSAVLATGSSPRRLGVPGHDLDGIHHLRTIGDSARLHDAAREAGRVAVVGAGWIGSEVAASLRQLGAAVVLIDPLTTPLQRVLGDEVGAVFAMLHRSHGVELRMGVGVAELRGRGRVREVVLDDGSVEAADVVVVGIGVLPEVDVAQRAGLRVEDGVVTDELLRTSARGIFAAGDVASAWHPHYRHHLRVEHWANALHQGRVAGANAAGGSEVYDRLPYFFSDQYDLGMEYVGHHDPTDSLAVRGSISDQRFVAFWHWHGRVSAALSVNTWDVIDDLKAIVGSPHPVDPARLVDPSVPLSEVAPLVPSGGSPAWW